MFDVHASSLFSSSHHEHNASLIQATLLSCLCCLTVLWVRSRRPPTRQTRFCSIPVHVLVCRSTKRCSRDRNRNVSLPPIRSHGRARQQRQHHKAGVQCILQMCASLLLSVECGATSAVDTCQLIRCSRAIFFFVCFCSIGQAFVMTFDTYVLT